MRVSCRGGIEQSCCRLVRLLIVVGVFCALDPLGTFQEESSSVWTSSAHARDRGRRLDGDRRNSNDNSVNQTRDRQSGDRNRDYDENNRESSQARASDKPADEQRGRNDAPDQVKKGFEDSAQEPPRTMAEAFQRLFKPTNRSSGSAPLGKGVPALAPSWSVAHGSFSRNEVLAVSLGPAALKQAKDLGFEPTSPGSAPINLTRLALPPGLAADRALELLRSHLPKERFVLNKLYRVANDARASPAKSMNRVERPGSACIGDHCAGRELIAWSEHLSACTEGLRVGIIDTRVDHEHPTFAAARLQLGTFIHDGLTPAPAWHGTGILALLAGGRKSGTPGLIPHAEFFVASVFFADTQGDFATDTISVLKALDWMDAFNVKLINMSFAGPKDELVQKAIEKLSAKGVVFIAAVGNEGPTAEPSYPAAYKQVIAVTAVNRELRGYHYANRGEHIDVAAPGVDIWTAMPGAKEGYYSGTSFAAPYVTSVMATIYSSSSQGRKEELFSRVEVKDLGPPGRDPIYGRGLLLAPKECGANVAANDVRRPASVIKTSSTGLPGFATSLRLAD